VAAPDAVVCPAAWTRSRRTLIRVVREPRPGGRHDRGRRARWPQFARTSL